MSGLRAAVLVTAIVVLVAADGAGADEIKLRGTVGPGRTITLVDASGAPVSRVPAGPVEIEIDDLADEHNFHLTGNGLDTGTEVDFVGSRTLRLTLTDGTYSFICDPHALTMKGSFRVGDAAPAPTDTTPATPPAAASPSAPVGARLILTSGPGFTITLKTSAGRPVTRLRPGRYTIVARDVSIAHNARITGAGVATRATLLTRVETQTWKVTLRKGTLTYLCDPHPKMRGRVTVA